MIKAALKWCLPSIVVAVIAIAIHLTGIDINAGSTPQSDSRDVPDCLLLEGIPFCL